MEKIEPQIDIGGTLFIIDVVKEELREKADPKNIINIKEMFHDDDGYHFHYDSRTKNMVPFEEINSPINDKHIKLSFMPNLTDFAPPVGIIQNYTKIIDKATGRTDPDLSMQEGSFFDLRWNKKILPTLDIAGQTFFVDTAINKLRPKDDFSSKGIDFREIKNYYDPNAEAYIIPYNPTTHEFQEIDHLKITELPKEIIVVKFPNLQELDKVGCNIINGFGPAHCISEKQYQMNFKALILPWEQTNIPNSIKLNLKEKRIQQDEKLSDSALQSKKGRKI
ncbi:hypothetical protein [Flavobacterium notoginsengisoli]|uniref:hypothetical protein n=1 Tax=Flavobacterium notoginsengisoli TaxID=1478199 RepID=UPI00362AF041